MRLIELQSKDVIDVNCGEKIGYVVDVEIDLCSYSIVSIVVERNCIKRIFSFFKEPPCFIVPRVDIISIGQDVILINMN